MSDDEYAEALAKHAAQAADDRSQLRGFLTGVCNQLSAARADVHEIGEVADSYCCDSDCCPKRSQREDAIRFLEQAQLSVTAARALLNPENR